MTMRMVIDRLIMSTQIRPTMTTLVISVAPAPLISAVEPANKQKSDVQRTE